MGYAYYFACHVAFDREMEMNKSERRECAKLDAMARSGVADIGYLARAYSALIRASMRSRHEIITIAASVPEVVQHRDFVV